jgi:hypothetical protein
MPLLLLCLLPLTAAAAPVTLDGSADHHELLPHVDGLVDPGGDLGIEEVTAGDFRPMDELDAGGGRWPGQRQPMVWLRFSIHVPPGGTPDAWYLVIGRPYNPGTVYVEQEDGAYRAVALRLDEGGGSFRAELPVATGTRQVFIRVPGPLVRPSLFHVATAAGHERLLQGLLTTQGLYVGVMLAMLLVNLFVGALLRDRAQLWYVAFIASTVAVFAMLTGTASRFVFETVPAAAHYRLQNACLALTVLLGIQFSRLFLDTPRLAPRLDRVMRGFLALAAAVLVAAWIIPDELSTRAVALLGLLVPLVALSAGASTFRAGSRWARFYLVGWSIFTIGGFLFAVPIPLFGIDGMQIFQLKKCR